MRSGLSVNEFTPVVRRRRRRRRMTTPCRHE